MADSQSAFPAILSSVKSLLNRYLFTTRTAGILLLALGLYFASTERQTILRTGHAHRKSASVPLILCLGLVFTIDPNARRIWLWNTALILGFLGGVYWWWNFQ